MGGQGAGAGETAVGLRTRRPRARRAAFCSVWQATCGHKLQAPWRLWSVLFVVEPLRTQMMEDLPECGQRTNGDSSARRLETHAPNHHRCPSTLQPPPVGLQATNVLDINHA